MLLTAAAFVALAVLALAFGHDSRDGLAGDEAARWDNWRWAAAERRGRLGRAFGASQIELDFYTRPAEALAFAASARLGATGERRRSVIRPALAAVAYGAGELLMAVGRWLQQVGTPREAAVGGPV
jgi:hypothetical protein